jgi:hypothetical protein
LALVEGTAAHKNVTSSKLKTNTPTEARLGKGDRIHSCPRGTPKGENASNESGKKTSAFPFLFEKIDTEDVVVYWGGREVRG